MDKIKYLEGLRGVAAFIVVLHHFLWAFYPAAKTGVYELSHNSFENYLYDTPLAVFFNGNLAIMIFFMLSGYVLSYKFFINPDNRIAISGIVRRYFRLLLPVFASVFLAYLFMKLSFFHNIQAAQATNSFMWLPNFWTFEPNFMNMLQEGMFGTFFTGQHHYNDNLWTMKYEFYGSLLIFSFLLIAGKSRWRYFAYIVLTYFLYKSFYLGFIIGLLLSDLNNGKTDYLKKLNNKYFWIPLLLISLFLGSYPMFYANNWYHIMDIGSLDINYYQIYHEMAAFGIFLSLLCSDSLKSFFSHKIPVFLGKISFSLYLTHCIFICSLSSYLFLRLNESHSYNLSIFITFIVTIAVCLAFSSFMYLYVDLKSINLAKYIYNKVSPQLDKLLLAFKKFFNDRSPEKQV